MGKLELKGVNKVYRVGTFGGDTLHAVKDVSFTAEPGQVISLIGESGSGKSTIGKMILRLTRVSSGQILFDGKDVSTLKGGELRPYQRRVQGVFQDPFSSYNPIFKADRVFGMVKDSFYADVSRSEWEARVGQALKDVALDPDGVLGKYPHQLSGGQLQRMLVARALLLDIDFLVADEIISMLDASTRVDVLNLLGDLKAGGLGVLFVTHDLSLGNYISDRAIILRRGRIVESGRTSDVFDRPSHPYTQMLLESVPALHGGRDPALWADRKGRCLFHEAYPDADAESPATLDDPSLVEVEAGHLVTCAQVDEPGACPRSKARRAA
ncbi:MAG TPA: ATP-binding cassette domain-containing protein [Anaerolineae bacterium]|nr:ATP-binding cassette domain-containing protein [Anaerolineae bacterium]